MIDNNTQIMNELIFCSWKPGPGTFWSTCIITFRAGTCGSISIWSTGGGTHSVWSD